MDRSSTWPKTRTAKLFFTHSKVGQASCKAFIFREALRDDGEF